MAITFVDFTVTPFANATSGSFTLPASWADGDLGVFWWWTRSSSRTFTKPTDVVQKMHDNTGSDVFGQLFIGYRHLVTGDSTFPWTCSSVTNQTIVFGCSVFRGTVGSGDPFEAVSATTAQQSNSADVDPPPVTVVNAGACVLIINTKTLSGLVTSDPTNYSAAGGGSTTLGNDGAVWLAYRVVGSAGTEDPGTWDMAQGTASGNMTWTAAIAPPAAPSTFVPKVLVF